MKRIMLFSLLLLGCADVALAGGYNYVEQDQFRQWVENGKDMSIVDIQVPAEFQQHHFKGALETNSYPVKSAADKHKLDTVLPHLSAKVNDVVVVCPRVLRPALYQGKFPALFQAGRAVLSQAAIGESHP